MSGGILSERLLLCLVTDRFFDIETPNAEIGYEPTHDAEDWMTVFGDGNGAATKGTFG